ncbi:MAG: hypothetical protein HY22_03060 [[Candidatus Thermochlorobacteriaceae] bacterium GBChlB]|nr:MAG: hypothetical protein HY22_03060 [[Candidatus Thermochlorobacteriaceae] bacterium GBChlB]
MLGLNFVKFQPTTYALVYQNGKIVREGIGLSFFYYAPTTSLVAVPTSSVEAPFMFEESTADYQKVTIQGQLTYRISDAKKTSQLLNYTLDSKTQKYLSDDPQKLSPRVINAVQVLTKKELAALSLREALKASDTIAKNVGEGIRLNSEITSLGLEILGFSVLAIKPNQDTSRALEAEAREQILKESDNAIYARRNAALEQERKIKENELSTELAVEQKKRQIRETQMDAELSVQQKQQELQRRNALAQIELNEKNTDASNALLAKNTEAAIANAARNVDATIVTQNKTQAAELERRDKELISQIALEEKKKTLALLASENVRTDADARAYAITAMMKAYASVDAKTLQTLASAGMDAHRLIAQAFRDLADGSGKIGQLNISPDLLSELLNRN